MTVFKKCTACKVNKAKIEFAKNRARPDGCQTYCKVCYRAWAAEKSEQIAERMRAYYRANSESRLAYASRYKKENQARYNEAARAAFARTGNTPDRLESLRAYQARKMSAMPAWADRVKIKAIYAEAKSKGMEVDHVVPLLSPIVCGLHCESNLQPLPRSENRAKSNKTWPGMP